MNKNVAFTKSWTLSFHPRPQKFAASLMVPGYNKNSTINYSMRLRYPKLIREHLGITSDYIYRGTGSSNFNESKAMLLKIADKELIWQKKVLAEIDTPDSGFDPDQLEGLTPLSLFNEGRWIYLYECILTHTDYQNNHPLYYYGIRISDGLPEQDVDYNGSPGAKTRHYWQDPNWTVTKYIRQKHKLTKENQQFVEYLRKDESNLICQAWSLYGKYSLGGYCLNQHNKPLSLKILMNENSLDKDIKLQEKKTLENIIATKAEQGIVPYDKNRYRRLNRIWDTENRA